MERVPQWEGEYVQVLSNSDEWESIPATDWKKCTFKSVLATDRKLYTMCHSKVLEVYSQFIFYIEGSPHTALAADRNVPVREGGIFHSAYDGGKMENKYVAAFYILVRIMWNPTGLKPNSVHTLHPDLCTRQVVLGARYGIR